MFLLTEMRDVAVTFSAARLHGQKMMMMFVFRFLQATGKELVCLRLSACDILDERTLPTVVKHCPFLQGKFDYF